MTSDRESYAMFDAAAPPFGMDTERGLSRLELEGVQSPNLTGATRDHLLAILAVFETRLDAMCLRLDNIRPLKANTLGAQPYSGCFSEMNGESEISSIEQLAKDCDDQEVYQSDITGVDTSGNIEEGFVDSTEQIRDSLARFCGVEKVEMEKKPDQDHECEDEQVQGQIE